MKEISKRLIKTKIKKNACVCVPLKRYTPTALAVTIKQKGKLKTSAAKAVHVHRFSGNTPA